MTMSFAIPFWTIRRRVVVQRWPAVPTAAKRTARTARSRFASSMTMIALLPPSSRSVRPRRSPTTSAMRRPIRHEPVAEISGSRRSAEHALADVGAAPITRLKTPGQPFRSITRFAMFCTAIAVSGVFGDGFQIIVSPQTAAIAAFQAQTATGKLNAVMMPTGPSGCHCSYIRCCGRSQCIVRP